VSKDKPNDNANDKNGSITVENGHYSGTLSISNMTTAPSWSTKRIQYPTLDLRWSLDPYSVMILQQKWIDQLEIYFSSGNPEAKTFWVNVPTVEVGGEVNNEEN
jgi:hypothetical protein